MESLPSLNASRKGSESGSGCDGRSGIQVVAEVICASDAGPCAFLCRWLRCMVAKVVVFCRRGCRGDVGTLCIQNLDKRVSKQGIKSRETS